MFSSLVRMMCTDKTTFLVVPLLKVFERILADVRANCLVTRKSRLESNV